jgi:hypothetical protein
MAWQRSAAQGHLQQLALALQRCDLARARVRRAAQLRGLVLQLQP